MKKRVKILASAFLLLGFLSISTETTKAATTCYSTTLSGNGMWNIWRCTPGPEGCVREQADEYLDPLICSSIIIE